MITGLTNSFFINIFFAYIFLIENLNIRIFGAGYWRKGRKIYEQAQG